MLKRKNIIKYQHEIILFFILVFAIIVWSYEITLPYFKAWETGYQDLIARNYVTYGFFDTTFLNVISVVDGNFIYRFNHPPLLQIILAFSFKLFGIHEWSARIIPIAFSTFSILILYKLSREVFDKEIALYSVFFSAFVPMSSFFGRNVGFEAPVLFFGLIFIYNYQKFLEKNEIMPFIFMILATILGLLTDWPFIILLSLVVCHSMIIGKFRVKMLGIFLFGFLIISLYLMINDYLTGNISLFSRVIDSSKPTLYLFSIGFYKTMLIEMMKWFTPIVVVLFVIGCINSSRIVIGLYNRSNNFLYNIKHVLTEGKTYIPLILTLWGLLYIFAFPEHSYGSFGHPYWAYYLIPGFSIMAALGLKNTNAFKIVGCTQQKIIVIVLFLFLISSISFTYFYHQQQPQKDFYEIGLFVNNQTEQDDLIAVEFTTIAFYADRHFIGIPSSNQPIRLIEKYKPKIVEIVKLENNKQYLKSLKKLHYELIYDNYGRQVWQLSDDYNTFSFASNFDSALIKIGQNGDLLPSGNELGHIRLSSHDTPNKTLSIYQHPIPDDKVFLRYENIEIPQNAILTFGISMDHNFWNHNNGDGVLFEMYIDDAEDAQNIVFNKYIDPKNIPADRKWHDFEIPLTEYSGKNVTISFVASSGPRNDTSYDGAYWGEPKIIMKMPNNNSET